MTALDSTALEFLLTLGDPGSLEFDINIRRPATGSGYIAGQQSLATYANDGILRGYRVVIKAGATTLATLNGKCFVRSFQEQAPSPNAAITAKVTLRCSGTIVRT